MVVHSVIDNLTKGASGQAIQNMILIFWVGRDNGLETESKLFLIQEVFWNYTYS
ncbi:MAG: hypothetical protein WDM90_18080 [Ferruginibacter sp.]